MYTQEDSYNKGLNLSTFDKDWLLNEIVLRLNLFLQKLNQTYKHQNLNVRIKSNVQRCEKHSFALTEQMHCE